MWRNKSLKSVKVLVKLNEWISWHVHLMVPVNTIRLNTHILLVIILLDLLLTSFKLCYIFSDKHFFILFRFAMELVGLGNLSPNLVMIGFKEKWRQSPQDTRDYVSIIQNALELRLSVGILRIQVNKRQIPSPLTVFRFEKNVQPNFSQ